MTSNHRPFIAPSILSADFTALGGAISRVMEGGCGWLHCDIMDGHFVPNISFGPMVVEAISRQTDCFLDTHLMIEEPDRYIEAFSRAGAGLISVHCETCPHLHRTLQLIRHNGARTGVAINPATSLTQIEPVLDQVELVVLMSVNPGFGGQAFIESTYDRIRELVRLRDSQQAGFRIQIDGGVGPDNAEAIARAGGDILVAGSSVFKADDITARFRDLTRKAENGRHMHA